MPDIFIASKKSPNTDIQNNNSSQSNTEHIDGNLSEKQVQKIAEEDLKPKSFEKHMNAFSTYCVNPQGVSFADQEKDEKILLFLRRHIITNVDWLLLTLVFSLIPIMISLLNLLDTPNFNIISFLNLPPQFTTFFVIFYYFLVFTFVLVNFMSWFYNIGLVTDKRVVDIDLTELIFKNIATTKHSLIQDVSYSQNGAIRSLFHFGDVTVQTAGQEGKFELEAVPHPDKVVHLMEDFIGRKGSI